jgi:ABC-type branched-subunit amino acid transport system substrate-binding protein
VKAKLGIALLALALVACASLTGDRPVRAPEADPAARAAYLSALEPLPGDPGRARLRLNAFVRDHPKSRFAPRASLKLARLARLQSDATDADRWLGRLIREHPRSRSADSGRLERAEARLAGGDAAGAREALSGLRVSRLAPGEQVRATRLQARITQDPLARLLWLERWRSLQDGDSAEISSADPKIDRALASADPETLARAALELPPGSVAARVALEQAARALVAGDREAAEEALARAAAGPLPGRYATRLATLRAVVASPGALGFAGEALPGFAEVAARPLPKVAGASGKLGVVLPLSGPFAEYGEASLEGILLAAGIFEPAFPGSSSASSGSPVSRGAAWGEEPGPLAVRAPGIRLEVRDSGGEPARAAAAVRALAADPEIRAILGPLRSAAAEAAAVVASEEAIPLLTLSARPKVTAERPDVFRLQTTPDDEVEALVQYAIREGARRFAILYPEDAYGRGMRERFWRRVEAHGSFVVGVASYDPEASDFKEAIQSLIGFSLLTADEKFTLKERSALLRRARRLPAEDGIVVRELAPTLLGPEKDPLPPIVDFDALFIPDASDKIALLAPQLTFHEIENVQLLGPSGWHHPELIEIARRHVSDAVIASRFDPNSRFAFVANFSEGYRALFKRDPDAFAAEAYDATRLVMLQLRAGRDSRAALSAGLRETGVYGGASGVLRFEPDGNAQKRPFLIGVRSRRFVSLD